MLPGLPTWSRRLHDGTTRILLLGAGIEGFALGTQVGALSYQVIDLLSALQHTLDGLVQHNLGLVHLLLDLHDAICLGRVLASVEVFPEAGKGHGVVLGDLSRFPPRVLAEEVVKGLGEDGVGG